MNYTVTSIIKRLKAEGSAKNRAGMARFGINADKAFGIRIPVLRQMAKEIGKNHMLAIDLWQSGFHECRLLAAFIADKKQLTETLMERWVKDFNSWDICDQAVMNLFDKHPLAYEKAVEWSKREPEFEKRAGYAMMASLAIHDKKRPDEDFKIFYKHLERGAKDNRNFVKKAVNWAIRQMGKRSLFMRDEMLELSDRLLKAPEKSAQWVAKDAIKELNSPATVKRIKS